MKTPLFAASVCVFLGCASHTKVDKDLDKTRERLRATQFELQNLRDENSILKEKLRIGDFQHSSAISARQTQKSSELIEVPKPAATPVAPLMVATAQAIPGVEESHSEVSGDQLLYAKVIESYQTGQKEDFLRAVELLEKGYPESEYVDNALYLRGLHAFSTADYRSAIRTFQNVRDKYPQSNKVSAALFAEAMALKKLGRSGDALARLKQVAKLYPGSPESQRVDAELRMLGAEQ